MILRDSNFSFSFDSSACEACGGNCCVGESGYIWVGKNEIEVLASFLNMAENEFIDKYLVKVGYRFSLQEKYHEELKHCCIFFDENKKQCGVYEARPTQCRTFPFWDYYKFNILEVQKECPGIRVGQ